MILYSIVPWEIVFKNDDSSGSTFLEMEYIGEKVIVSPTQDNRYVINRIISTSPKAYLNPKLQPGVVIDRAMLDGRNL
ncbi:hypothetical protein CDQ84_05055 [Clostridium thermosuccinogenes]|jgi:hypothetical protein|uniref:Uncharacterized protein n=1 Tax=Clostridium thermosuccinogenes TaxID=84032 RepID=A0A2K2FPD1_9CLOT|nr:YlzJ-like family protein [Pseudoclostridium thermosuccinogenes]AUS96298.1 hypothetical protein CDO33_07555 [Pseudoclostridium thermosuccinogenes]PNT93030.1 hypothetical protein CDQ83_05650 [Pseudoclostridium thermosuccinogenes]PNT98512.1 hypothetical protein CDQ85_04960 [Pseudoclostridium thermosuccinogenes]PNU00614.1 hypothetical protein CDQ84_05055 [Pseudoclostridium thermosuccinogenes]